MTEEVELLKDVAEAAKRLGVEPHTMLAAIQGVSVNRRGSIEWSQHDLDIAESCLGAWLAAGSPHELKAAQREERLEEALLRIQQWAKAYPVKTFKPVSIEDLRHCQFALKAIGIDMGALHAEWARHLLNGIAEITEEALE